MVSLSCSLPLRVWAKLLNFRIPHFNSYMYLRALFYLMLYLVTRNTKVLVSGIRKFNFSIVRRVCQLVAQLLLSNATSMWHLPYIVFECIRTIDILFLSVSITFLYHANKILCFSKNCSNQNKISLLVEILTRYRYRSNFISLKIIIILKVA